MAEHSASAGISAFRLQQLTALIAAGASNRFYDWPEWERIRSAVLAMDHWECQACRERHRYRKAVLVHHVKHLRDRPDLALSVFDPSTGARQLISLCRSCHEEQHPERMRKPAQRHAPVTEERWD